MSSEINVTSNNTKLSCKKCCKTIAKTRRFISCQQCESKFHIKCYDTEVFHTSKANKNNDPPLTLCLQCKQKNKKCGKCSKVIGTKHRYINCSKCLCKVHIKCNETDENTYNQLKVNQPILCIRCKPDNFPFQSLTDANFLAETASTNCPTDSGKRYCGGCNKIIAKKHRKIECKFCSIHFHITCNLTDVKTYNKTIREDLPQVCRSCHPKFQISHDLPDLNLPQEKLKCGVCTKTIASNHRKIQCCSCNSKIHIKCNKTDAKTYNLITKKNIPVICIKCQVNNIPFQNLSDLQFAAVSRGINADDETLEDTSIT